MRASSLFPEYQSLVSSHTYVGSWRAANAFSGIESEYQAATTNSAFMDRSYLGTLRISGQDHLDLLHRITTNELRTLKPGQGQITLFTTEKGRLVDRVGLYRFDQHVLLVSSPDKAATLSEWIQKFVFIEDVRIEAPGDTLTVLSLFGPESGKLISDIFATNVDSMAVHDHLEVQWKGCELTLARIAQLNPPGFNLILPAATAASAWQALTEASMPMGEAAYDVLRIEAGWPVSGREFDEETNPHEANLLGYVDFDKGCYVGQEVIARLDTYDKVQRHLVGLLPERELESNQNNPVMNKDGQEIGRVTSHTYSLGLRKPIALARIRTKFIEDNLQVEIREDAKMIRATLASLPFQNT